MKSSMTCLTKYPHGRIRMTIHMPRVSIWDGVDIDKKKRKWTWKIQTLINREYIHNYCKSKKEAVRIPLKHISLDLWELNHIKEDGHNYINADINEPVIVLNRTKYMCSAIDDKDMEENYLCYQWSDDKHKIAKARNQGHNDILCYVVDFSDIDKTAYGEGDTVDEVLDDAKKTIAVQLSDEEWFDDIRNGGDDLYTQFGDDTDI